MLRRIARSTFTQHSQTNRDRALCARRGSDPNTRILLVTLKATHHARYKKAGDPIIARRASDFEARHLPRAARMHNSNANGAFRATRFYVPLKLEGSTAFPRRDRRRPRTTSTDFSESIKSRALDLGARFNSACALVNGAKLQHRPRALSVYAHRDQFATGPPLTRRRSRSMAK